MLLFFRDPTIQVDLFEWSQHDIFDDVSINFKKYMEDTIYSRSIVSSHFQLLR
jgi:hypothetical protein